MDRIICNVNLKTRVLCFQKLKPNPHFLFSKFCGIISRVAWSRLGLWMSAAQCLQRQPPFFAWFSCLRNPTPYFYFQFLLYYQQTFLLQCWFVNVNGVSTTSASQALSDTPTPSPSPSYSYFPIFVVLSIALLDLGLVSECPHDGVLPRHLPKLFSVFAKQRKTTTTLIVVLLQ